MSDIALLGKKHLKLTHIIDMYSSAPRVGLNQFFLALWLSINRINAMNTSGKPAKTNRKKQIITAALQIISEEGTKSRTMMRIARKIGTTDAALYRHFKSKHDLMLATIHSIGQDLNATISQAAATADAPLEKLKNILQAHLEYLEQHRGIPRLVFSDAVHQQDPVLRKAVLDITNGYLNIVRNVLASAVEHSQVKGDIDTESTAFAFLGLIQTTCFIWSLSEFNFPISQRAAALWRAFSESLS